MGHRYYRAPASWTGFLGRIYTEINDDNCLGMAAQLAFYGLLALFPALIFLVALLGYLPVADLFPELLAALARVAPQEAIALLRTQLDQIVQGDRAGLLTLGILGALWSSSVAMVAIIDALNRAYDVVEWRAWWKRRLLAIGLTLASALFIVLSFALVVLGPTVAERVAAWLGLAPVVALVWQLVRWPTMVALVVVGLNLVYHFAPNRHVPWVWITPGALVATLLWIGASFGFKFYITHLADYTATYGSIGGAIVTMLWFYMSGLAILIGAEVNAVIEQSWPSGDEAAPRAPQ